MGQGRGMRRSWIAAALLVALLVVFRLISASGYLPNFSPLPALLLCSLVFFRGAKAWLLPLGAWALTDPLVSLVQRYPIVGGHHVGIALGLVGAVALGFWLRRHTGTLAMLGGSLAAAVLFYFFSNTVAFLFDPLYAKNAGGFVQAQWTGPAGFGPTWLFLRNLAVANLLFTGVFLVARHSWAPATAATTAPAAPLQ